MKEHSRPKVQQYKCSKEKILASLRNRKKVIHSLEYFKHFFNVDMDQYFIIRLTILTLFKNVPFKLIPTRNLYSFQNIVFWNLESAYFPQCVTSFLVNRIEDILQVSQTNNSWCSFWFLSSLISFIHVVSRFYRFLFWGT